MVSEWNKVAFNVQNIAHETDRAMLVKMPHCCEYDGYSCWVAKKLVKPGSHSYEKYLSINYSFTYKIFKNDANGKRIDEKELDAETFAYCFTGYLESKPKPLAPIANPEVDASLLDK